MLILNSQFSIFNSAYATATLPLQIPTDEERETTNAKRETSFLKPGLAGPV